MMHLHTQVHPTVHSYVRMKVQVANFIMFTHTPPPIISRRHLLPVRSYMETMAKKYVFFLDAGTLRVSFAL